MVDVDRDDEDWADRLRAFAPFDAAIRDPSFQFGIWHYADTNPDGTTSLPWFEYSDEATAFLSATSGWMIDGFDWRTWSQTDEARRLLDDPAALDHATPQQIARLLTALTRQDRFVEGELAGAFESGLFGRILRRVAGLSNASPPGGVGSVD